jgi:hypothetical protein
LRGILKGLTQHRAATDPRATDPRLRGRTYAIPFDDVWSAATRLLSGGLPGWTLVAADDQAGVIEASTRTRLLGLEGFVRIQIGLDENAQTRVDAVSTSATHYGDLGRSARVLARFFRELDRALGASPGQILDATRTPPWLAPH